MYFRHECIPILFMNGTGILKHLVGSLIIRTNSPSDIYEYQYRIFNYVSTNVDWSNVIA